MACISIFRQVGLSPSEAINVFFRLVIANNGLPFPVRFPNTETRKVLKDINAGRNVKTAENLDDIYKAVGLD